MGQTLSEPVTFKESSTCGNDRFKVGSSSMQGWRVSMEDAHVHLLSLPDDSDASFFAVYDGHGGSAVSKYAGNNLHKYIVRQQAYKLGDFPTALRQGFLEFDMAMQKDEKMKHEVSGTTAVTVLIKGDELYCGNAGDSRAVACIKGECHPLSFDHKPTHPEEEARIKEAGGWVEYSRVNGNLALSRALGDFAFKRNAQKPAEQQMVTAYPDVEKRIVTDDWEFIILACDGIWDVVTNEEACDFVRCPLAAGMEPEKICEELMTACLAPDCQMGGLGCDNMTVVLICFLNGKPWRKYCSDIADSLEPSLLGYTRRLGTFSVSESSDDDDDAILEDVDAKSIAASLSMSLSQSRSVGKLSPPEGVAITDTPEFQDVIQADDYVHKEGDDVVRKQPSGGAVATGKEATATTANAPAQPVSMTDLVGLLDEDVIRDSQRAPSSTPAQTEAPDKTKQKRTRQSH